MIRTLVSNSALFQLASFTYHEVTDQPATSGFQRPAAMPYKHTVAAFREHLTALQASRFEVRDVTTLDSSVPGRHLLLTFDDGGASALIAAEELERRGWVGHFFIVTGLIGTRGFLDAPAIRELRGRGHVIGSHSHSHPNIFCDQPMSRMAAEWDRSKRILEQLLGEPVTTASVPGGAISASVLRSADAVGYDVLFTSEPVTVPSSVGRCMVVGRFSAKVSTPARRIAVLADFRGWPRERFIRTLKVCARDVMPGAYRRYVSSRTRAFAPPPDVAAERRA